MALSNNARQALVRAGLLQTRRLRGKPSTQTKVPATAPLLTSTEALLRARGAIHRLKIQYGDRDCTEYAPGYLGFCDGSVLRVWYGPKDYRHESFVVCAAAYTH